MYNRTPAYDGIIEAMQRKTKGAAKEDIGVPDELEPGIGEDGSVTSSVSVNEDGLRRNKLRKANVPEEKDIGRTDALQSAAPKTKPDGPPAFLKLLPISLECNKGAIVVGNEHTKAVITAQFEKATGEIDASRSGPLDVYQQLFNFQFTHPVVHMKPNPDYKSTQLETAIRLKQGVGGEHTEKDINEKGSESKMKKDRHWIRLPRLHGLFSKSTDSIHMHPNPTSGKKKNGLPPQLHFPGQERWQGLTRYLDESQDNNHGEWSGVEYARTSLIADVKCVNVSFYWDITGPVPSELENSMHTAPEHTKDINGSDPPEYGMDIQVFGGTINYGPWADRHRAAIQSVFFPGSHVDAVPASRLTTGQARVLTVFKIFLSIEEDTVLRIPLREPSKDWKWKGKAHTLAAHEKKGADKAKGKARGRRKSMRMKQRDNVASGANARPFAWMDIKVAKNSTVNYVMDMVPSAKGFRNKVDVDLVRTEISSSVNHGLLWRSGAIALDCDLSNPLSWNSLRKWGFNIMCRDLELFLLRDHLFLLTDLVADWGSGPSSDYFTFVPFQYLLNIDFVDFKLYLNTNDSNIVNNPSDLDDNAFLILYGQRLHGDVTISLDRYKPLLNEIRFDVRGQDLGLELSMPSKNTLDFFVQSKNVATVGALTLTGTHTYFTETSTMHTDRLFMDIQGERLSMELYGWLIQQFLKLKENYFGEDLHFRTLEEFQGLPSQVLATEAAVPHGQPAKITNDLDVILCISAEQSNVLLPVNLYSAESSVRADIPYVSADLRFTNYYMDLMVNFSPISISLATAIGSPDLPHETSGRTELFVESVVICGHRLFGLPPVEPTYLCNWDFEVGKVSGECTSEFVEKIAGATRAFAFTFDDDENTLPATNPTVIHDATFLRLKTEDIRVWFYVESEALTIGTGPITLEFNDLAGPSFSQRLIAQLPNLVVGAVDARSAARHRARDFEKQVVKTHAFVETSISLNMFKRKLDFTEDRKAQQAHMKEHDQRTNRTPFMFIDDSSSSMQQRSRQKESVRPPAMPYPEISHPIFLFQPRGAESGSSISSGYYSDLLSIRGRRLRSAPLPSTSTGSLAHSVRSTKKQNRLSHTTESSRSRTLLGRSKSHSSSPERQTYILEENRKRRNLPPSSVALSSSLSAPYFPLNQIEPDLSDVPSIPQVRPPRDDEKEDDIIFNDASTNHLDESFSHTSVMVSAEPGIRIYCTPEAIRCASNLMTIIQPRRPEDLLDDFQAKVMTKILDHQKRRDGIGASLEFGIRIPFVHARFHNAYQADEVSGDGKDQYDVILNRLKVATRIKNFPADRIDEDTISLHTTLGSLGVSVTERKDRGPDNDVAVQAEIRDLLVWMLKGKGTSININFKALEAATASRKIEYMASLIHRTTLLGTQLATRFEEVEEKHRLRLRYLAWFLTNVQEKYPDPAFLTKASYALRAARDHLRTHDSWKIISRFRYIWQCLPDDDKVKVLGRCLQKDVGCPHDVEERTIKMWDQWRTWDLAHVKKSLAMKILFGLPPEEGPLASKMPIYVDIRSRSAKLILDPGPRQSEVSVDIAAVNVAIVPPSQPAGLMLVETEMSRKSMIVQFNSQATNLHLSWEICELVETLINMFQRQNPKQTKSNPPSQAPKGMGEEHDLQLIYVTDRAEVSLDTINLRGSSTGRRLRLSVASSDHRASGNGDTFTILAHFEQAVMKLSSRSRPLLRCQFDSPSLYFARHKFSEGVAIPDEIKVAGASRKIKLQVEENILGLIEVIDVIVRDEVAYFIKQATAVKKFTEHGPKGNSSSDGTSAQLPNVTLALFMDAYAVEMALLQSLTWSIAGSSGRVSVVPTLGQNVTLRIDYDLAAHTHRISSSDLQNSNVISSLELPPVNGRLIVTNTENETRISASGIIETIHLQASEIQALIATINRPEISNVVHDIQDDIAVLKTHIQEVFPRSHQSAVAPTPKSSRDIAFNVQMTLSGLNVLASAPGQLPNSASANLELKLSSLQLKATNVSLDGQILVLPEAVVHFHAISLQMTLSDAETIRHCGNLTFGAIFQATAQKDSEPNRRVYCVRSSGLEVNIFADTASAVVDVMNHLQDKMKDLDLSKEKKYLRRLRHTKSRISHKRKQSQADSGTNSLESAALFDSTYSLELNKIQVRWIVGSSIPAYSNTELEDLVFSLRRIDLSTKKGDTARLTIEDMQLQMVPISANTSVRSRNSALLPEVVFNVAYGSGKDTRKIAFQAAGKSLDLRLDSRFVLPANIIERSIALAGKKFRAASSNWSMTPTTTGAQRKNPFGNKRLASLLVDANFAGAVVHISGSETGKASNAQENRSQKKGRYSQFVGDESKSSMALHAPGVALKVEYKDDGHDPSLNAELKIDGSSNTLFPTVVPLLIDISDSIKEVVTEKDGKSPDSAAPAEPQSKPAAKSPEEDNNLITADPSAYLGKSRLNIGLRICKQEFSLSCQPIARVAAITKLEEIYVTVNSVKSQDEGHFFAVSAAFQKLQASVQHVYSRESTFSFDVESIILSLMNSKHLSGTSGISAILKVNPVGLQINARQLQDFLLFREIWLPPEIRQAHKPPSPNAGQEPQEYLIQRYQQVTAATAFPWNANVAIANLSVQLDLGQAIGKTSLNVHNLWASSKKNTDWEQNLCIGVEKVGLESTGRTSGFVELSGVRVRTSISWPSQDPGLRQAPLVQASLGFKQLRVKAGFDYQAFVIADIANFNFLMYNVREQLENAPDRLVAILDGDKVHVFGTATSAAQGLALYQAIERLVQENQQAYTQSLKDIEKFLRRKSSVSAPFSRSSSQAMIASKLDSADNSKTPIHLHTDVVVTLRSINLGVYPSTFVDTQIFMLEAADTQARFAVSLEQGRIHSGLGMTLGKLSVALSHVTSPKKVKPISELMVEDVIESARSARGGTILRVPKLLASMETWQTPRSEKIDYIFKSSLEGKVDVGWNYSRISSIRTMWSNHSRTLASRLGKPLPESNIKITSSPQNKTQDLTDASASAASSTLTPESRSFHLTPGSAATPSKASSEQEKITAEIKVPQSRYTYTALEPPIIETPQLRDMGEATPPLEWIGLHRDRLPNVTHQIVIVTLLEVAREVEEAYERILGSS
jgi:hypothetical protein